MESQLASPKRDRKTVERNRRNHMKNLYSKLNSLIPNQTSSSKVLSLSLSLSLYIYIYIYIYVCWFLEAISLPDQLDEAANYIKRLEKKLEKMKAKKEAIRKSNTSMNSGITVGSSKSVPQLEIHEMGSALEVVLISGLKSQLIFNEIIRVLHEEGAEVVNASFSVVDDTAFHTIHSEVGESALGFGAARISERLKKLVHEFAYAP
ncbi:hypothetical protein HHK36_005313 [Tetracentron sinense]|uniref:BHLH domain-containing protein n=1 Tax=Tetracentron sinense TaxID=13715 RepID=A0A834ZKW0_TETSI|nr:hypothetical protein HHK36_005313 [Tetracentron sinense]